GDPFPETAFTGKVGGGAGCAPRKPGAALAATKIARQGNPFHCGRGSPTRPPGWGGRFYQ
ncbi:MAG: hypothetical protein VB089_05620, partial [Anaerolineaceae bacterium]|nr:hypothetical protein [Anaerolineaceae bacterium]